jgi:hypothetical protein
MPTVGGRITNTSLTETSTDDSDVEGGCHVVANATATTALLASIAAKDGMVIVEADSHKMFINNAGTKQQIAGQGLGNQALIGTGGNEVLIYADIAAGSDVTGVGSAGNPFKTWQRLVDEVPDGGLEAYIGILAAGTYDPVVFRRTLGAGGSMTTIGHRDATIALSSPSFSLVSGKIGQSEANIGAYTETITDGNHWAYGELDLGGTFLRLANTAMASTTPNFKVPTPFGTSLFSEVNTFATVCGDGSNGLEVSNPNGSPFTVIGVDFNFGASGTFEKVTTVGCVVSGGNSVNSISSNIQGVVSGDVSLVEGGNTTFALVAGTISCFDSTRVGSPNGFGFGVFRGGITLSQGAFVRITGNCDIESTGTQLNVGGGSHVEWGGNMTTANGSRFLNCVDNSMADFKTSTVTGAVAGVPVVSNNSSKILSCEVACSGTLTNSSTPGDEQTTGSAATGTFASLPTTDATQLCRTT